MRHTSILNALKTTATVAAFLATTTIAQAKDQDCWVEFFQESQYAGDHFRLNGPAQMENLRDVQGQNWESRIDSLKVGPKAQVTIFENPNFKLTKKEMAKYPELLRSLGLTEKDALEDSELIFDANSNIHDLSDFNFHDKIKSLKIDCVK